MSLLYLLFLAMCIWFMRLYYDDYKKDGSGVPMLIALILLAVASLFAFVSSLLYGEV